MTTTTNTIIEGHVGDLAYFDAFSGLIKVRVIGIEGNLIVVKVMSTKGAYDKGDVFEATPTRVIPRSSVVVRSRSFRIVNNYVWVK